MKTFNNYNILNLIKSKAVLLLSGSMILSSCVIHTGGYTETDGVYYDPNRDTLPEGYSGNYGNQIDSDYNYQDDYTLLEQANKNQQLSQNRYGSYESDWGNYTGTDTNYYSNNFGWGGFNTWGSPFGFYSPYRFGFNMGFSMGWGSPWGWNSFHNPYWGYGGGYYGGYWGHGYHPYGYGGGYYGYNNYRPTYYRSGENGNRLKGMLRENTMRNNNAFNNNGRNATRNGNTVNGGFRNPNAVNNNINGGFRNTRNTSGVRNPNNTYTQPRTNTRPTPSQNGNTFPNRSNTRERSNFPSQENNGGFRSGGNSGGFNSGGGMRSGGNSGGGMRSGGSVRSGR